MITPTLKGPFSFLEELVALIDGGHTRDRAALVIEDFACDMRRNSEPRHAGDDGAPQIVQRPVFHA